MRFRLIQVSLYKANLYVLQLRNPWFITGWRKLTCLVTNAMASQRLQSSWAQIWDTCGFQFRIFCLPVSCLELQRLRTVQNYELAWVSYGHRTGFSTLLDGIWRWCRGSNEGEATTIERRKLHNEELHNLFTWPSAVRIIKLFKIWWLLISICLR
jgi:hypothetical protein